MSRHEIQFQTLYSLHLEQLLRTLYGRADRTLKACAILCVIAAAATGLLALFLSLALVQVAVIAAWRPAALEARAARSAARWSALYADFDRLPLLKLQTRFDEAGRFDSRPIAALQIVAHRAAARQLDCDLKGCPQLNSRDRLVAAFAGA